MPIYIGIGLYLKSWFDPGAYSMSPDMYVKFNIQTTYIIISASTKRKVMHVHYSSFCYLSLMRWAMWKHSFHSYPIIFQSKSWDWLWSTTQTMLWKDWPNFTTKFQQDFNHLTLSFRPSKLWERKGIAIKPERPTSRQ